MTQNDDSGNHHMADPDLPVITRETVEASHDDGQGTTVDVAGILLAAGRSTRFGETNKLLAELEGTPIVRHSAQVLLDPATSLDRVVAVVGHEGDQVRAALPDGVRIVENPHYREGQASSVRVGLQAVHHEYLDAAVFALGDKPTIQPETVGLLVRAFQAELGDPLAAAYEGRRGNPVLFGARHFDALATVDGDTGGRAILLHSDNGVLVATDDPGVVRDVDTQQDLINIRRR